MDKNIFSEKIGLLIKVFPEKDIHVDIMWDFLKDLDNEAFKKAVNLVIINSESINKATNLIAVIRKYAKDDGYLAEQAWTDVLAEARRVGFNGHPVFKNSATRKAVECITWRTICLSEDLGFDRGVFIRAYNNFVEQGQSEESLKAIEGPAKSMIGDIVRKIGVE